MTQGTELQQILTQTQSLLSSNHNCTGSINKKLKLEPLYSSLKDGLVCFSYQIEECDQNPLGSLHGGRFLLKFIYI
jgi:hypothetical protein